METISFYNQNSAIGLHCIYYMLLFHRAYFLRRIKETGSLFGLPHLKCNLAATVISEALF